MQASYLAVTLLAGHTALVWLRSTLHTGVVLLFSLGFLTAVLGARLRVPQRLWAMVATYDGWLVTSRLLAFTGLFTAPAYLGTGNLGPAISAILVFIGGLWLYASLVSIGRTMPSRAGVLA